MAYPRRAERPAAASVHAKLTCMKRILVALVVGIVTLAAAQNLGKTDAQIIAMGPQKWQDLFTSKIGSSTADMCRANEIYGQAVTRRNDRLIQSQLDGDFVQQVTKCRELLSTYGSTCIDLAYAITGGGTMWNPVYAGITGDSEMTLYGLLSDQAKRDKARVVSDVDRLTKKLDVIFRDMRRRGSSASWVNLDDAEKSLSLLKSTFKKIVVIAAKMSRKDSDHLLSFCVKYAKIPIEQAE